MRRISKRVNAANSQAPEAITVSGAALEAGAVSVKEPEISAIGVEEPAQVEEPQRKVKMRTGKKVAIGVGSVLALAGVSLGVAIGTHALPVKLQNPLVGAAANTSETRTAPAAGAGVGGPALVVGVSLDGSQPLLMMSETADKLGRRQAKPMLGMTLTCSKKATVTITSRVTQVIGTDSQSSTAQQQFNCDGAEHIALTGPDGPYKAGAADVKVEAAAVDRGVDVGVTDAKKVEMFVK